MGRFVKGYGKRWGEKFGVVGVEGSRGMSGLELDVEGCKYRNKELDLLFF